MSVTNELKGRCICGAISVTATNTTHKVGACHCKTCRRWGSGPFMEVDCGTEVSFNGEENISVYDSSEWAERGFCAKCGSHLFYRLKESGQHMVAVGLFDDNDRLVFDRQVFIDEKPAFYRFADDTENLSGAEIFAKYGSSS